MLVQLQLLNLILYTKDISIITNNGLNSKYFSKYINEFEYIYNHYKKYNQVPDIATFLSVFPNFEVIEVSESLDYLLSELRAQNDEEFIISSFNKVKELVRKGDREGAMKVLLDASNKATEHKHLEAVDILSDISRYDEYTDKCNDFKKYYIPTGFKELDLILGGWDRKSELAVWSARSGNGKSWALLQGTKAAVERGLNVGLFSGEMELNKVGYRFDTLMSHLSNGKIIHGNIDVSNDYKVYLESLKQNHKGSLYVLTPDKIDGDATVDVLRSFIEKYNLDILFVDQHSLLVDKSKAKTSFEKAANISKDLKYLQTIKQIPIISAVQQNRSAIEEGKSAGTENIAGSDRVAQDATTILFINTKDDIMTISIGKARDGGTGKSFDYTVDFNKGMFTYIPSEDDLNTYKQPEQTGEISPMNYEYDTMIDSDELPFN